MSTKFFVSALFVFFCLALNAAPPIEESSVKRPSLQREGLMFFKLL
jgi:hypothetical protein